MQLISNGSKGRFVEMPGPGEAAVSWKGESPGEGRWHPGQAPLLLPLQTSRSDALSSLGSPFQPINWRKSLYGRNMRWGLICDHKVLSRVRKTTVNKNLIALCCQYKGHKMGFGDLGGNLEIPTISLVPGELTKTAEDSGDIWAKI